MKKETIICSALTTLGIVMIVLAIFINNSESFNKKENKKIITTTDVDSKNMGLANKVVKNVSEESSVKIKVVEVSMEENPKSEEPIVIPERVEVFEGMTIEELSEKIERNLNSTISGKGTLIASYSLQLGIDPYLATAIILHETGCKWNCSSLVNSCNNVGGQKGSPGCNGGSYKYYPTLDEGIMGYLDNLYKNYWSHGLTTTTAIGPKYAGSTTWASQVNSYINTIRAS